MESEVINGIAISSDDQSEVFVWRIEGLWQSSKHLPVERVLLTDLAHYLHQPQPDWYDGAAPTVRDFADQAKRIYEADLSYPIIISAEGCLMDGRHRLAKASLLGMKEIAVVRFPENPDPDWRKPKSA